MAKMMLLLLVVILSLAIAPAAEAAFCRTLNNQAICILSIKRSAKNHWEYRAVVSVDGAVKPIEIYNCRDRLRVRQDGAVVRFTPNDAGELICSTLK